METQNYVGRKQALIAPGMPYLDFGMKIRHHGA